MSVEDSRSPPQLTDYEKELIKSLRAERRRKAGGDSQADAAPVPKAPAAEVHAASTAQGEAGRERSPAPSGNPPEAIPLRPPAASARSPLPKKKPRPRAPSLAERVQDAQPPPPVEHAAAAEPSLPETARRPVASAGDPRPPAAPPGTAADSPPTAASRAPPAPVITPRTTTADTPRHAIRRSARRRTYLLLGAIVVLAVAAVVVIAAFKRAPNVVPPASIARESVKAPPPSVPQNAPALAPVEQSPPAKDDTAQRLEAMFASFPSDRRKGRAEFRKAVLSTAPNSEARRRYLEVSVSGLRLRDGPSETGPVLGVVRRGAFVRLKGRVAADEWCEVRLAQGREGWTKCSFLKPIAELSAVPGVHGAGRETAQ